MQIAVLAVGWRYLLFFGRSLGALPSIIIGVLLIAHVIHLWNYPEFIPTDTNVAYWVRLGNLVALSIMGRLCLSIFFNATSGVRNQVTGFN